MPFGQIRNMPPRQVFNLEDGGTKRKLVRIGESDSLGVTMSNDKIGKRELGPGDEIVMRPGRFPHTFEYHLPLQDA